jgi:hypothetical protein
LKKLMMVAAMLALVLALAVPAIAQVAQEAGTEIDESGGVELAFETSQTGNNSSQCAPAMQFGNTGNLQNNQSALQYASTADDIEFEGGDGFVFEPGQEVACDQAVQQSAAASG